ncbi:hypothetical protein [Pedobacter jamesrossensis]|uniref:Uncharacterized protein n=1 Tax=Pedobacter jamesrossensis TaxID=1908238 RepID=A0ABV8NRL3_9SPHI
MKEKNISQPFETFNHNKSLLKGEDHAYHSANQDREVLLRYLLERLNLETGHLSEQRKVRK